MTPIVVFAGAHRKVGNLLSDSTEVQTFPEHVSIKSSVCNKLSNNKDDFSITAVFQEMTSIYLSLIELLVLKCPPVIS